VLVDVSRSGREYPADFRSPLPFSVVHDNVSMYVDELYASAPKFGATLLYALFPNTYIDTNRSELDIDPAMIDGEWPAPLAPTVSKSGLGLLKSKSRYGEPMQERKFTVAEVRERLDRYYRPYHAELKSSVDRLKRMHGFVYHISCHCMSAVGAPTHRDRGRPRPDFCISDINGTTATPDFVAFIESAIRGLGYSVKINDPYVGGELNSRHGAPADGVESIMLEINKKLFMDVATFKRSPRFGAVKENIDQLLAAIAQHARSTAGRSTPR